MSGGNRVVAVYADRLTKRGHRVNIVSQPRSKPSFGEKLESLLFDRSGADVISDAPFFGDLGIPVRVLRERRPIKDADVPDADIVIATWWETAEWVAELNRSKGAKVHLVQHHEVFPYLPVERCKRSYRLPLRKIVISRWLKELLEIVYEQENIALVPNSVDRSLFLSEQRGKQKYPTVGLLYSTVSFKGVDVAIAALCLVKSRIPSLRVVAFGSEPISKRLPLPDWAEFQFRPPQDQLRSIYSECDVWICASRSEGFHLPPLEAMACRCPVVSTRVGGPMDVVIEGVNGYLVDINDVRTLADRVVQVLQLPEMDWQEMSDAALATATRYTWEDATVLFEKALKDALLTG